MKNLLEKKWLFCTILLIVFLKCNNKSSENESNKSVLIKTEELYPFEIYAVIGNVEGIEPGVYRYIPQEHKIVRTIDEDVRDELCAVALCRLDIITNSATYIAL